MCFQQLWIIFSKKNSKRLLLLKKVVFLQPDLRQIYEEKK